MDKKRTKRERAPSAPSVERKPFKLDISREDCLRLADLEGDQEVGAGFESVLRSLVDSGVLEGGRGGDGIHPNEPGLPKLNVPVNFPYFATFRAIAFAVEVGAAKMLHISVEKFQQEFNRQFALAPGETPAALPVADARNEGIEEALSSAIDCVQKYYDTYGDIGDYATRANIGDWFDILQGREPHGETNSPIKSPPAEGGK